MINKLRSKEKNIIKDIYINQFWDKSISQNSTFVSALAIFILYNEVETDLNIAKIFSAMHLLNYIKVYGFIFLSLSL